MSNTQYVHVHVLLLSGQIYFHVHSLYMYIITCTVRVSIIPQTPDTVVSCSWLCSDTSWCQIRSYPVGWQCHTSVWYIQEVATERCFSKSTATGICTCIIPCVWTIAIVSCIVQAGSQPPAPLQVQVLKPNELFYSKIIPLLKEKGLSEQTPRKDWPHNIQLRVLKELMAETPNDLLGK